MRLQRNCIGLASRPSVLLQPNCCRTAFDGENFIQSGHRRSSLFVAQYRRNDGNGGEGSKSIFLLKIACFSFDRGRAIRLLTNRICFARRDQPSCFDNAADLLWLGRGAAIRLQRNCIGPAHRPSIQCQIGVPIKLGPMPRGSSAAMNLLWF